MSFISPTSLFLARTVDPAETPITLEEAKAHLRLTINDEDVLVTALIQAVTDYLDVPNGVIGQALVTQTWAYSASKSTNNRIVLPISPAQSVTAIDYYDADNVQQSLTVGDYYLFKNEDWAYLEPKPDKKWPVTYSRPDAITVTFVCGYGAAADVPQAIKQAMLLLLAHWYENRSATTDIRLDELPMAVQSIINLYRKGWVA